MSRTTRLPPPDSIRVRRAGLALVLGVTPRQVSRLVASGVIPAPDADHMYRLVDCHAAYCAMLAERPRAACTTPEQRAALTDARDRLTAARARVAEMDADERAGLTITADEVERTWTDRVLRMRSRMLAIPSKAAPLVAAEDAAAEVETTLRALVEDACAELQP